MSVISLGWWSGPALYRRQTGGSETRDTSLPRMPGIGVNLKPVKDEAIMFESILSSRSGSPTMNTFSNCIDYLALLIKEIEETQTPRVSLNTSLRLVPANSSP
jgi:hypothetical protein